MAWLTETPQPLSPCTRVLGRRDFGSCQMQARTGTEVGSSFTAVLTVPVVSYSCWRRSTAEHTDWARRALTQLGLPAVWLLLVKYREGCCARRQGSEGVPCHHLQQCLFAYYRQGFKVSTPEQICSHLQFSFSLFIGKVPPCSPAGIGEQWVLAPLCHGPVGMSRSPLCVVICGEGRVAHRPVLAVGWHHPLPKALLGAIRTVHGRSSSRFPHWVQSHVHHSTVVLGRGQRRGQRRQVGEALWELFGVVLGHRGEIQGVAPRSEVVQGSDIAAGELLAVPSFVEPVPPGQREQPVKPTAAENHWKPTQIPGERRANSLPCHFEHPLSIQNKHTLQGHPGSVRVCIPCGCLAPQQTWPGVGIYSVSAISYSFTMWRCLHKSQVSHLVLQWNYTHTEKRSPPSHVGLWHINSPVQTQPYLQLSLTVKMDFSPSSAVTHSEQLCSKRR